MGSISSAVKATQGGPAGTQSCPSTGHGMGDREWASSWEPTPIPRQLCFQSGVPPEVQTAPLIEKLLMTSLEGTEQLSSLLPEMQQYLVPLGVLGREFMSIISYCISPLVLCSGFTGQTPFNCTITTVLAAYWVIY